ncbi:anticodon-binding aminoacyl-tRNA synthetase, class 1a [Tanacetum coccineum]|uniref:Anticodon-binding aminoacyl-tRNA synthetase, class 1a n=1 Tax=Tanacetum coccineum TaxID=301880 RepID=A0ABQ5GX72_9ASTR
MKTWAYAGSHGDRKSTTGGCQFLGRRLISWQCKKQTIVATSSTEAEYVAAASCCDNWFISCFAWKAALYDDDFLSGFVSVCLLVREFLLVTLTIPTGRTIPAGFEGPPAIIATIDRTPYTITESLVRSQLQLDDEGGVEDLPTADIYLGMDNMGYPTEGKLTFHKNKFSPQWRYLDKLTALCSLVNSLVQKIDSQASDLKAHKLVFKEVAGKLVKKVKELEDKLKGKKRKFVMTEYDIQEEEEQDVDPLIKLAKVAATAADDLVVPIGGSNEDAIPLGSSIPSDVFAGGSASPPDVTTGPTDAPSDKGKSPMLEEKPPVRERSFRQREEDRLGAEAARRFMRNTVHANQGLSADLLGPDVNEDNFAERMVAIIAEGWTMKHVRSFSDDQLKDEFDKIRHAVANLQSQHLRRSFKRQGTDFEQPDSKNTRWKLVDQKMSSSEVDLIGADLQPPSVEVPSQKASQEDVEVPSTTTSTAQQTTSSTKKVGTRRKQFGQKGVHPSRSTIPIEDEDPDAEHKMCIKYASDTDSDSDDDTPVNLHGVVDWELLPTGLGWVNVIYRKDNSRKCFSRLREILHLVTRTDLMIIYGRVMQFYQDTEATGVGLVLWGDLKVLIDSPEVNDGSDVWKNQNTWIIQSWKLYSSTGIHVLETVSGLVLHMFVDKRYPLSVNLIERMLEHQLEICRDTVGNELTTAVQLITFLKKQISDSRRPKVHDCCGGPVTVQVSVLIFLLLIRHLLTVAFGDGFQDVAVQSSGAFNDRSI